jgi:hypothetical protein
VRKARARAVNTSITPRQVEIRMRVAGAAGGRSARAVRARRVPGTLPAARVAVMRQST